MSGEERAREERGRGGGGREGESLGRDSFVPSQWGVPRPTFGRVVHLGVVVHGVFLQTSFHVRPLIFGVGILIHINTYMYTITHIDVYTEDYTYIRTYVYIYIYPSWRYFTM